MDNNSIQINSYLQNEMSADERMAFEKRLSTDTELQKELKIQERIIIAVTDAGLKAEFAKAIRRKNVIRRSFKWGIAAGIVAITILLFNISSNKHLNEKQEIVKDEQPAINNKRPFIDPPLPCANVPLSEYNFDAAKGDIIYHSSGSVIYFPPSALLDAAGNIIKGMVKVTYREFADPVDFFVSGIPMQYDSAGTKYNFESSGMCEINAYQDNKAVFVNPKAKPQINLSGTNKSPMHNVYFLDTVSRSWKFVGKDFITEVKNTVAKKTATKEISSSQMITKPQVENDHVSIVKPLKPAKALDDHQAFSIAIDPGSFEELYAYDNVKFEVLDESTYKRSDADEHWNSVKLERTGKEGIYNITFTNTSRKVTYKVRPVLEGADYDAALKVFTEKEKLYQQTLKNRLVKDQQATDSINTVNKQLQDKYNADNALNNKMNTLIMERNKRMRAFWKSKMEEQEKRLKAEEKERQAMAKQLIEEPYLQIENNQAKYSMDMRLSAEVMRTFAINNFGVWNCDHPQYPDKEVPVFASYADSLNTSITFSAIAVVYKGFNGLTQFAQPQIRVMPGQQNMIWTIKDSSLYYFTYQDFMESGITMDTRSFTFKMRKSKKPIASYDEMRQVMNKLSP